MRGLPGNPCRNRMCKRSGMGIPMTETGKKDRKARDSRMKWEENVRKVVPYTPGEQPDRPGVVKLNTNENPYPRRRMWLRR